MTQEDVVKRIMAHVPKELLPFDPTTIIVEAFGAFIGAVVGWLVEHCLDYIWPPKEAVMPVINGIKRMKLHLLLKHLAKKYPQLNERHIVIAHNAFIDASETFTKGEIIALRAGNILTQDGQLPPGVYK